MCVCEYLKIPVPLIIDFRCVCGEEIFKVPIDNVGLSVQVHSFVAIYIYRCMFS